ncbi:dephospho-CoA kinase [Bifidobacterium xylocopae]|uniref:dephospho-CoA kinase n=1 Tax=Bifidobacterium xylocopae TaxID=2493119 RepID=UPI001EEDA695|nr:dephospho-CoA kinase [Bifidobacterium xylocopae]
MLRVGLTGGIAAGKSTVSGHLADLGARIIDYDAIAHRIMEPGGEAVGPVREAFGPRAIRVDGSVDRPWLARLVFSDDRNRRRLNALTHPLIVELACRQDAAWGHQAEVVVHDIPLLADVRGAIPFTFAHVITVEAPAEVRIARMVNERHMTRDQAVARVESQAVAEDRERLADIVIDSSVPIEQMFERLDTIYEDLRRQAAGESDLAL